MRKLVLLLMVAIFCQLGVSVAEAKYPTKPVTIVTVFNPGGGSDVSHRTIEKFAKKYMEQPFVITYKPGAGGEIGWTEISRAKPTGYLIGGFDLPHIILQPMLRPEGQPGYQTEDLNPICGLVMDANVVMVKEDSKFKTMQDLIDYAKKNPGKVTVGTVGKLTGDHLFLMQIEEAAGVKFVQVPYPGSGKVSPALLSGEVDCYFGSGSSFLRMENVRGLAIATKERYELCPDVPTLIESGLNIESAKFRGLASPQKFPKEAQEYLEGVLSKMAADPEYQQAVKNVGLMPMYQSGADFKKTIENEKKSIEEILKNVKLSK